MTKARHAADAHRLEDIPNIGPSLADDLRALGIRQPAQLHGKDPVELYLRLCTLTEARQDPCVLDTFIAAVGFIEHDDARPWWARTAQRKRDWPGVEARLPARLRRS